jgi:hypothetical protein
MISEDVLTGLIGVICESYIDDIIIYANSGDELKERVEIVMGRLRKHNLRANLKKCKFGLTSLEFLGYVISKEGISLSDTKKKWLLDIKQPENVVALRSYLGVANHFSNFIPNLAMEASVLYDLTAKGVRWVWTKQCEQAFKYIKDAILRANILYHVDYSLPLVFRSDASEYGVGGTLFNIAPDGQFKYIAFVSRKFSGSAKNWSVIDKEAYAIFYGITALDYYLRGRPFIVECDHRNIAWIRNNPEQKARVGRMDSALREYSYVVAYIPGKDNNIADMLSRCLATVLLPDGNLNEMDVNTIIDKYHNAIEGHHGMNYTIKELIRKGYRWQSMRKDIIEFIQNCPWCQKNGHPRRDPRIVEGKVIESYLPFWEISIDSIVSIPKDNEGNNHILVIIDSFSRFVEIYATKDLSANSFMTALLDYMGRYGVPKYIRTDKGKQFLNETLKELGKYVNMKHLTTIGYRSQANGIVERCNQTIMNHLRAIVNDVNVCKHKWAMVLPLVQRIVNSTVHTSLGVAPRELIFGTRLALERDIFGGNAKSKITTLSTDYVSELDKSLEEVISASQVYLAKILDNRINYGNSIITDNNREFGVRDYVIIDKYGDVPGVLNAHYKGPYLVIERSDINNYLLRDLETNKEFLVHADRMTKFIGKLSEKEIKKLSNTDRNENLVVEVLGHRKKEGGSNNNNKYYIKKKDYEFHLLLDTGDCLLLPYLECKQVELVQQYIRDTTELQGIFMSVDRSSFLFEDLVRDYSSKFS